MCRGAQSGAIIGENGPIGVGQICLPKPPYHRIRALLYEGGNVLEVPVGSDAEAATLVWLTGALERAREEGRDRLVGYLEAVADDAVFEAEAAARRGPRLREDPRTPTPEVWGTTLPRARVNRAIRWALRQEAGRRRETGAEDAERGKCHRRDVRAEPAMTDGPNT